MSHPGTSFTATTAAPRRTSENHYCGGCLRTRAFQDRGDTLRCPVCRRELKRVHS